MPRASSRSDVPGTRLSGKHREPLLEAEFELVDQGDVLEPKSGEHPRR